MSDKQEGAGPLHPPGIDHDRPREGGQWFAANHELA